MKLGKIRNYKFSSKIRFLTTLDLRMKFGKIQNFQSRWKFDSKLTLLTTKDLGRLKSLTTQNMQRIKVSKIQKFLVVLKIWRKIWEIWPLRTCGRWNVAKSRNFLSRWKFGSKMRVLTTPNQQRMKFDKIQKNFDLCCKFDSKMRLTTLDLRRMKFGKIQNFQSRWKFDSKLTLLTTKDLGRLKSLTTQNMQRIKVGKIQKFLVALKIWRKI